MLTLLTPTGERPEAFSLLCRMMTLQDYNGPVHWIIVDDGAEPQPIDFNRDCWTLEVIRPKPVWQFGQNTQGRNLVEAMKCVASDALVTIVEDDDYYAPNWLSWIVANKDSAEVFGEGWAVYYNPIARMYFTHGNDRHCSLRCTVFSGGAIERFWNIIQTPRLLYDIEFWKRSTDRKVFPQKRTVGIKGMPGRAGLAQGHQPYGGKKDPDLSVLRKLIGDHADWYASIMKDFNMTYRYYVNRGLLHDGRRYRSGEEFTSTDKDVLEALTKTRQIVKTLVRDDAEPTQQFTPRAPAKDLKNTLVERNATKDQVLQKPKDDTAGQEVTTKSKRATLRGPKTESDAD
ncbi:MAG: hypothetical protein AAF720_00855 [Pseudomonadota bacterium]